jgi:hypothetical protein
MTDHEKALEAAARAVDRQLAFEVESDVRAHELTREEQTSVAQAAITAYLAQREADGAVMVPVAYIEAVSLAEMYLRTGLDTCERCGHQTTTANLDAAYELRDACAMIAARPNPAST